MNASLTGLPFRTVDWIGGIPGKLRLLDQTRLPATEEYLELDRLEDVVAAIHRLSVRGAPAIGCAAAYGVVVGLMERDPATPESFDTALRDVAAALIASRPTAVNLAWGVRRMEERARAERSAGREVAAIVAALLEEARAIEREDVDQCRRMGEHGAELVEKDRTVLTHCNAGALATAGIGTALAPVYVAHAQGKSPRVFADETRPLLQGARLTAWELSRAGVPVSVSVDGAAAMTIASGAVDLIFVGSDRIARNGDVCNKIGTYAVALAAHRHGVPFYVVAPVNTIDPDSPSGAEIPIEMRDGAEVASGYLGQVTPDGVAARNPAFDVTPAELVTGIVTEFGVLRNPDRAGVEALLRRAGRID
ncbi:MAG: S-methyl-5-thioribose-1-phosphate isomerase [Planctomycetota bacterium]